MLRIGFIGAGAVNFGGGEGPWDHASRLEQIEGLEVVGIADPNTAAAKARLAERSHPMYAGADVFGDYRELLETAKPDAVWIGVPPSVHGTLAAGRDIEVRCAAAGVHMFVEKPLSSHPAATVAQVAEAVSGSGVVCSVGYMFRYSRAVQAIKAILIEHELQPAAFLGRYDCAYSEIRKAQWWDRRQSGGPIVEQATHFVDLARYLLGEARLDTVQAIALRSSEQPLFRDAPADDDGVPLPAAVPEEFRAPAATAATWKHESGAVASLTHGVLLHREKYESELEVWADGLRVVLMDPYGDCRLAVRRPGSEETEVLTFAADDTYLTENQVFVDAVRRGDAARIASPYADAFRTYELTWAITTASD